MITTRQLKAALALLRWRVEELAHASGISEPTIWRLESADGSLGGRDDTAERIVSALEAAGIEFLDTTTGVRLVPLKSHRQRLKT